MNLSIGIVGLPNVGKSTLFKVLTKKHVDIANYPFCTISPSVGVVQVPDERLSKLAAFSNSKKIVPAVVEFVDIAGLVKGASKGEGLGNQFLANIRQVDAICHVVRVFKNDTIVHVQNRVDAKEDMETIETELILADMETVNKALQKLDRDAKSGDKEAIQKSDVVKKIQHCLEQGTPARDCQLSEKEWELIRDLHLLSQKPVLYVYNVSSERDVTGELKEKSYVALDIKTEEDITEMPPEERTELGVESKITTLIVKAYELLGLITFLTTGEEESRAWTIRKGSKAPEAGAAIHSDFQEKFIRAEIIFWEKLLEVGSFAKARELGLVRTEGKEYVVQDGDVIEFKI